MKYTPINKNGQIYIIVTGGQIKTEEDGLALISACVEHGTNLLMLPAACLSEDFLRLSTRAAGLVLQKLRNYNIKAVAILDAKITSQRFKEFLSESNKGQEFRIYNNFEDAEAWLLGETQLIRTMHNLYLVNIINRKYTFINYLKLCRLVVSTKIRGWFKLHLGYCFSSSSISFANTNGG